MAFPDLNKIMTGWGSAEQPPINNKNRCFNWFIKMKKQRCKCCDYCTQLQFYYSKASMNNEYCWTFFTSFERMKLRETNQEKKFTNQTIINKMYIWKRRIEKWRLDTTRHDRTRHDTTRQDRTPVTGICLH